jgi:hypothetical protein
MLHLARSYDTGLVATFEDQAGLDAYTIHPTHQEVANLGKEIAEHVVSVDFIDETAKQIESLRQRKGIS